MPTLSLAPDIGQANFAEVFDSSKNPFVLSADVSTFTPAGVPEGRTDVKGVAVFRLTIAGVVYDIPLSMRKKLRGKNGGRVFWQTDAGESGEFKFYRNAPPVFFED
ncbi:MAG: hypothetical protein GTO63_14995, partial [Anaerolineae bacterium]|nr:hypothetical protein [Anaerolineae bacterium]NIN96177.1 hypothetical protein [Anaerolineae bacterium]NIQ79180.1 hypothetical protein [Anaerolineae bacterium]